MRTIKDILNNEILRAEYSLKTIFKTEERDRCHLKLHELKILSDKLQSVTEHDEIIKILKDEIVMKQNQFRNSKNNRSKIMVFRDVAAFILHRYKEASK